MSSGWVREAQTGDAWVLTKAGLCDMTTTIEKCESSFSFFSFFRFFRCCKSYLFTAVIFWMTRGVAHPHSSFLILLHMSLPLLPWFFFPFLLILLLLFPAPPFFFTCVFFLFHSSPPYLSPLSLLLVKVLISGWSLQTDWSRLDCVSMLYLLNHTGNIRALLQCDVHFGSHHCLELSVLSLCGPACLVCRFHFSFWQRFLELEDLVGSGPITFSLISLSWIRSNYPIWMSCFFEYCSMHIF